MTDRVDPETRSRIMRAVRSRDTQPELLVRRRLHALGFRFRVNVRGMPGTPDVVLPRHRAVVMVHGCFWHGHRCCRMPDSDYWREKIARNLRRDRRDARRLRAAGWRVFVVRECALEAGVARVARALAPWRGGPDTPR